MKWGESDTGWWLCPVYASVSTLRGANLWQNCALHRASACAHTADYFYSSDSEDSKVCVEYVCLISVCSVSCQHLRGLSVCLCRQVSVAKPHLTVHIYIWAPPSISVWFAPRAVTSHSIYGRFTLYSQQSWFYGGLHPPARGRHQLDLSGIRLPLQSPFHEHPVYKHYWFSHCAFCTCI